MPTIIDVARRAGVSKSTVSLVINKSPYVKDETRQKIEQAIIDLDYAPNQNARGLVQRTTKSFGIIIAIEERYYNTYEFSFETGQYSYNITNGIPNGLQETDYGLLTERFCANEDGVEIPKLIQGKRVDGIFLVGGLFKASLIDELIARGLPAVAVGRYYDKIDSISVDVAQGVYRGVSHLFEAGHKDICYINSPKIYSSSKERLNGLRRAAAEHGCKIRDDCIVHCESNTGKGGYLAFKSLWESGARPGAIATANEPIALGIMRYLYEQNIRIPDDISLVAYEASVLGGYSAPAITSVNINKEKMGEIAAQILLRRMKDPDMEKQSIVVQPELLIRNSVKEKT
jgi:DNA-binding LacI/PurR family transcriptional regulator